MPLGRRKRVADSSTTEALSQALKRLRADLRRAGLARPPTIEEQAFLSDFAQQLSRLAKDEALDPELRAALEGVATTADWLRDPPESPGPIVDLAGGGG